VTVLVQRVPGRLPAELARRPFRVLRPQDAAAVYAHPRPEFARLTDSGTLHKLATGYYAIVPDDLIGRPWLPELESLRRDHLISHLLAAPGDNVISGFHSGTVQGTSWIHPTRSTPPTATWTAGL
jgi:hypothetical protein